MGDQVTVPSLPACDFCLMDGKTEPARYDAKTKGGPWANMCEPHMVEWSMFGIEGLGTGRGQRLVLPGEVSR